MNLLSRADFLSLVLYWFTEERSFVMPIWQRTLKLVATAVIAIWLAQILQLENTTAAGVIGILTVLDSRSATLKRGYTYFLATIIAFMIASFIFYFLGFHLWSLGIYLSIFVPIAYRARLETVIAPVTVLVTHFYIAESIAWSWQVNGFLLMALGVMTALMINFWMPSQLHSLEQSIQNIESQMRVILANLALQLNRSRAPQINLKKEVERLENSLQNFERLAFLDYANQVFSKNKYYVDYHSMRQEQCHLLKEMVHALQYVQSKTEYHEILSSIFIQTAAELDESNTGQELLQSLADLFKVFRQTELPHSREEFEIRAVLYQYLLIFERFLELKYNFYQNYKSHEH